MNLQQLLADLSKFPWRDTAITLRQRFRDDHLGLTASSLTFTTSIALVPFFTVALAIFTAFPMFAKLQGTLQVWLVESLIPDNIARQVLGYLTQFTRQASRLGVVGLAVLTAEMVVAFVKFRVLVSSLAVVVVVEMLGPVVQASEAQYVLFGPVVQDHSHQHERQMNNEPLYYYWLIQ